MQKESHAPAPDTSLIRGKVASDHRLLVSIREAGRMLCLTPWDVYQLCDAGEIASGYIPDVRHRLVSVESVREYAARVVS